MSEKPKLYYNDYANKDSNTDILVNDTGAESILKQINLTNLDSTDKKVTMAIVDNNDRLGKDIIVDKGIDILTVDESVGQMYFKTPYYRDVNYDKANEPTSLEAHFKEESWDAIYDYNDRVEGTIASGNQEYTYKGDTKHVFQFDNSSTIKFPIPEWDTNKTPIGFLVDVEMWRYYSTSTSFSFNIQDSSGSNSYAPPVANNSSMLVATGFTMIHQSSKLPNIFAFNTWDFTKEELLEVYNKFKFIQPSTSSSLGMFIRSMRLKWLYKEDLMIQFNPISIKQLSKIKEMSMSKYNNVIDPTRWGAINNNTYSFYDFVYKYKVSNDGGVTFGNVVDNLVGELITENTVIQPLVYLDFWAKIKYDNTQKVLYDQDYYEYNGTTKPYPTFQFATYPTNIINEPNPAMLLNDFTVGANKSMILDYSMPIPNDKKLSIITDELYDDTSNALSVQVGGVEVIE